MSDVRGQYLEWWDAAIAPVGELVLIWSNGVNFGIKDERGQWRKRFGQPFHQAPSHYMPLPDAPLPSSPAAKEKE